MGLLGKYKPNAKTRLPMTPDTIVFETPTASCSPTIRRNILNHFYNEEDATIVGSKANLKLNSEYAFTRKNIRFKSNLLPSHSSEINACYDEIRQIINFNFSLPKAIYGTNLFFLKYAHFRSDQLCSKEDFILAKKIIDNSILHLSEEYFEPQLFINQIDFSINLLMQTKEEALTYINQLKNIQGKWKPVKVTPYQYDYSVMWVYDYYSIKCYIKGVEMKKHPGNLNKIYEQEDINYMYEIGERTIRYEVSIRKQKIKELYSKTFRTECEEFAMMKDKEKAKFFNGHMLITTNGRSPYFNKTPEGEKAPDCWYNPVFDWLTYKKCEEFARKKVEEHMITLVKTEPSKSYHTKTERVIHSFLQKGWSIAEMINENIVSKATYYRLKQAGKVPDKRQKLTLVSDRIYDYPNGSYFAEAIEEFNYIHEEFENGLNWIEKTG